jgi:hypothetical protein
MLVWFFLKKKSTFLNYESSFILSLSLDPALQIKSWIEAKKKNDKLKKSDLNPS